jgi:hypothetical protein
VNEANNDAFQILSDSLFMGFSYVSVLLEAPACPYASYEEQLNKSSRNFILDYFTKIGRKYPNLDKNNEDFT